MTAVSALLLTVALLNPQAGNARAEAERLARSGAHAEALQRFQAIAAANPDDIEARLWIGRLHATMRHPTRAASVFEAILAAAPQNVDALVGLGSALMDLGRWSEAADALNRAEALAADRVDVLAAQGRFHGASGHATLGLAYYGRALAAEPGNEDIRAASDALRATRAHRIDLGYDLQAFDPGNSRMHAGTIEVNARVNDALRVFGRAQAQGFDGTNEARGGGGVEWRAHRAAVVRAGVLGGGTTWLPGVDVFAQAWLGDGRVRWTLAARYLDFEGASVLVAGPGIVADLAPRVSLRAEYLPSRTQFDNDRSDGSGNGLLGVDVQLAPRLSASLSYRRGLDYFEWFTADRIGAAGANTLSVSGRLDATPFVTLAAGYDYQDRSESFTVHRVRAWLTYRFGGS